MGEGCGRGEGLIYDWRRECDSVSKLEKNVCDMRGNDGEGRREGNCRNEEGGEGGFLEIQERG